MKAFQEQFTKLRWISNGNLKFSGGQKASTLRVDLIAQSALINRLNEIGLLMIK